MTKIVRTLIVRTDSYTGNTDSALLGYLFGIDDERTDGSENVKLHNSKIDKEIDEKYFEYFLETRSHEEYGSVYYAINDDFHDGYNSIEFYPFYDLSEEEILETVNFMKQVYGDEIEIATYSGTMKIKILGYHLKTETIEEEIKEI